MAAGPGEYRVYLSDAIREPVSSRGVSGELVLDEDGDAEARLPWSAGGADWLVATGEPRAGAKVQAYDPEAAEEAARIYGERDDFVLCKDQESALEGADCLAIVTEWREFRSPDFDVLREKLTAPIIFDGRNLYDPNYVDRLGFEYYAIGRGRSVAAVG